MFHPFENHFVDKFTVIRHKINIYQSACFDCTTPPKPKESERDITKIDALNDHNSLHMRQSKIAIFIFVQNQEYNTQVMRSIAEYEKKKHNE